MFRRGERPLQQGYVIVNGVRFTWQHDGALIIVNNSIYGRVEHTLGAGGVPEDVVRHLALELLCRGPRKATELFPGMTSEVPRKFPS